jgi:hypothetical protein
MSDHGILSSAACAGPGTFVVVGRFVVAIAALSGCAIGWSSARRLEKRNVADVRGFEDAAISPLGDKVALYVFDPTYRDPSGASVPSRLEIRDVNSLKTDSVIDLPPTVEFGLQFQWSKPVPRVHYCDRSNYILVYIGDGVSTVINVKTGQKSLIKIHRPPQTRRVRGLTQIAGSCAEQSNVAAFDIVSKPEALSHLELFDLDDGKKVKEIPVGTVLSGFVGLDVSPSGDQALTYEACYNDTMCAGPSKAIHVLNTRSPAAMKTVDAGHSIGQVSFADDSSIVVVGENYDDKEPRFVKIFNLSTGKMTSQVGDERDPPMASASVSADGRLLFAYTGREDHCENCNPEARGYLQVHDARFTVWDLATAQVIARSPEIAPFKIHGGILEDGKNVRTNERPRFQFSRSGNAVLVTNARDLSAIYVFLLRR